MKKLDVYLANLWYLNVKLHNLHWNVFGPAFKATHEYLEHLYDMTFEKLDEVAELQLQIGMTPPASVKRYAELATIKELEDMPVELLESIKIAKGDFELMDKLAREVREEADEKDLFLVANLMEDDIADYAKEIWFMESMLK